TRQEAVTLLGVDPERIVVIPEGYDHDLFKPCSALQGAAIKQKYGLPDRYLLFVGAHEPRKNIDLLLKARGLTRNTVPLVWAGWSGWGEQQHGDMLCLGYVPDHDLAGLYSGAAAFVYPSLYEGFGLPVLEAMACGCPVICSRTASLPEVAGDAALYCDPGNADELADCIDQAIEDTNVREAALLKGPKRAAGFSWQLAAQQTIEVFKNAASG
ncbi:MAG: glycosyltransferase family 4 protein, partial [Deltaproteobacteria bacterium]|nr:glycosyltransferase family 4 protein [Deltaproteobacteria bacterium]